MRSDLETKRFDFATCRFHWENGYFLDIGAAKWRQVGDRNWKDKVKIAKVEAKLGKKKQDISKRSEEEARVRQRSDTLRLEIEVSGSRW